MKDILKPIPALRNHPKDLSDLLKSAISVHKQPDNRLEPLLANSRPQFRVIAGQEAKVNSQSPSTAGEVQTQSEIINDHIVSVQSADVKNSYDESLHGGEFALGDSRNSPGAGQAIEEPVIESTSSASIDNNNNTPPDSDATRPRRKISGSASTTTPLPIFAAPFEIRKSATPTSIATTPTTITGAAKSATPTGNGPSLDKIVAKVVEEFQSREEIDSEEYLWYDDNGDLLWSQEANLGKNVKREVGDKQVRPARQSPADPAKEEMLRLRELTDFIDRFRSMLDVAQQVDYYLTKRLQAGINAVAAMYSDGPPNSLPKRR